MLTGFAAFLAYLYVLRIPLLIALVLIGFPFAALLNGSPLRPLFENLFMLDPPATCVTTIAAIVLAWSLLLTGRLVLLNGSERFGAQQFLRQNSLTRVSVLIAAVLAVPMIFGQFLKPVEFQMSQSEIRWNLFAIAIGAAIAYMLAYLALLAAVIIAPEGTQAAAQTFPAIAPLRALLERADRRTLLNPAWLRTLGSWNMQHIPEDLRAGYLDPRPFKHDPAGNPVLDGDGNPVRNSGFGLPWSGHWLAFTFAMATFALYYSIDLYKKAHLGEPTSIPALGFVLLLLLNMNWILAFLTFFLDRFRFPLILPLLALSIPGTHWPASDHYFQIQPGVSLTRVRPHEVLLPRLGKKERPIIVVATAGGGIQAAAWTAKVLTGLQSESSNWHANFADSICLISSVSGGAAGTLFFVNEYAAGPDTAHSGFQLQDKDNNFQNLVKRASDPSLDDVAWGLVYRDIPRILTPYGSSTQDMLLDRGRMLELSWQNRSRIFANLSNWREGVKEGWRPATIFNSTIVETGEPLLLATTDLDRKAPKSLDPRTAQPNRKSFYDLYPNADLPLVTAVRLAATFPFVSPAARAQTSHPEYHMVDGGYYDNYGTASVIEWLDEAFEALQRTAEPQESTRATTKAAAGPDVTKPRNFPPVLILQIRSFPDDALAPPKNRGWFFQYYAPVDTLLGVRTAAQLVRDRDELLILRNRWGKDSNGVPWIRFAGFEFTGTDAPLSWSMNKSQIQAIDDRWNQIRQKNGEDLRQVRCMFDPSGPDCRALAIAKGPW